ncbi:MAG: M42 family metallopeptidase [Omnitrophica WOR_2 bacterium]
MTAKTKDNKYHGPRLGPAQIRLLERLSNACAVSGDEGEVRKIILEQVRAGFRSGKRQAEVKVDALGNVLVTCPGSAPQARLRVMLAAHMDEVGLMITHEEEKGVFRFQTVGGVDVRQLPGKPVWIGKEHIPGVIGAKPIHLTKSEELKTAISLETLCIDTGLEGNGVKIGDRAAYATHFVRLGESLRGKALDNRFGVATLIELVKNSPPQIDLLAAFTVQEEVGSRGARVSAYALNPDLAIALDSTPAHDLPNWDETESSFYNSRLGAGPVIYLADSGTLSDPRLVRFLAETAETMKIPYQFRQPGRGGTDAGAIHRQRAGIPSISVSIPSRYQHTAASMGRLSDWQNTLTLLHAALSRMTPDILSSDR